MTHNVEESFEDRLNKVRIELYENIKDLSIDETVEYFNRTGREIIEKFGLKFENSPPKVTPKKELKLTVTL
jgi:hypothetical protein